MSLFPAYSGPKNLYQEDDEGKDWLKNNSFNVGTLTLQDQQTTQTEEPKSDQSTNRRRKSRWHRKRHERQRRKLYLKYIKTNPIIPLISDDCDLYCIDKTVRRDYLYCASTPRNVRPNYYVCRKNTIGPRGDNSERENNGDISYRYFMKKYEKKKKVQETPESVLRVCNISDEFNRTLHKESSSAEWIEFVEFQDVFFKSQNLVYKTESDRERAIKRRKLDILERALNFNLKNDELLDYWMRIGSEILSPDEMSLTLQKMLDSAPGMLSIWLHLISVRQHSLAHCTYSSVTGLYKKAINCLKSIQTDDFTSRDSDILELLFHYGRFLQDCGHWEALWIIFQTNIKLNFGVDINIDLNTNDLRIKELEDKIMLVDKQPIWVTWRMVEALREGFHFLPVADSVYYPQRCVFLNDLFDFVLHFHPNIHFTFIIKFLMLLKVPLLPFNTAMSKLLYKKISVSNLDSPEIILSTAFSAPTSDVKIDYLKFVTQISTGPQYLRNVEGQQEFLELIQKIFQACINIFEGKKKVFLGLWWLRFNRWLCILGKSSLATFPPESRNRKNFFKDFMQIPENRDNLLYYCEYSLFEYNQGNIEASIKILKTLISARQSFDKPTDDLEKAALCQVHRYLCELYIEIGRKEEAIKILVNLAVDPSSNHKIDSLKLALTKYESYAFYLIQKVGLASDSLEQILLPQYSLEWIHCYLWLVAISNSTACANSLYLRLDSALKSDADFFSDFAREYLYEARATILWTLEKNNPQSLMPVIKDGLALFPYNLKLLSLLASRKLEEHGLWWTFKQPFLSPPTIFGCVILICVALARKEISEEGFNNRVKSLFRQLALEEGKFSSLIHRMRLVFLFNFDHSALESAHVNAIELCPWNKSVYTSAVSVLPNKLVELTDILIEKEFRIHVTPDEIEVMRD